MLKINKDVNSDLTIIKEIPRRPEHSAAGKMVLVSCKCGQQLERPYTYVKRGRVKRCEDCRRAKQSKELKSNYEAKNLPYIHKRLSRIWANMKSRCYNESVKSFSNYGGRGITVCDEWIKSRDTFQVWALANGYHDELTLDRIDNNGNYEPHNCKWSTQREQTLNSRTRVDNALQERCITKQRNKFQVTIDGKYMGIFSDIADAIICRDRHVDTRSKKARWGNE